MKTQFYKCKKFIFTFYMLTVNDGLQLAVLRSFLTLGYPIIDNSLTWEPFWPTTRPSVSLRSNPNNTFWKH